MNRKQKRKAPERWNKSVTQSQSQPKPPFRLDLKHLLIRMVLAESEKWLENERDTGKYTQN